ncbi:MAG: Ig-like domain-containing protein [Verrucomicrobiae bacterium]|nr:Ig-like domain-containing protein [Verrucomicrobiae bacterium]
MLYSVSRKTWSVFFSCLSLFVLIPAAPAADVTLAWDASPDATVVGYRVYYGSVSGNYTNFIQVGNVTTAIVPNLRAGNRYYFAATANDSDDLESPFSNEVGYTVPSVNQPPTLGAIGDVTIDEDAGLQTVGLSGIGAGSGETGQALTVSAVSSNPGLIPTPVVSYTSPNGTGSLRFTPVADGHGSAVITVTVNDGQTTNNTVSRSFTVTVRSVNDAPTLDAIVDQYLAGNGGARTVGLSGISSGAANEADALTVSAVSSDPSVVLPPVVSYTSPSGTGSLRLEPAANRSGSAVITVTVNDGQGQNGTVSRSFTVTVQAENQSPTISTIADRTIISDTNSGPIGFVISDEDTLVNSLTLTASSSAPGIVPVAGIVFGGSGTNRTVRITPVADSAGTARITLTVSDGTASASTAFNVIVQKPQPAVGQLSVVKNGEGTITPDLTGTTLIVGQSYTVTAIPASGYVFSSWSGSVVSTSPTLTFIMQSNTVIQANFVGDPYLAAAGTYNGLFNETDEVRLESAGTFSVYVDNQGHYSAWVQMGYVRYPFSGALSQELRATNTIARWEQSSLVVELEVGRGATAGQIFGRITDGRWTGQLSGGRPASSSDLAGEYTAVFPGIAGDLSRPAGDGYATIHVAADGLATMSGTLADGTRFMQSAYITVDGDWPLGVSMYAGKGLILSWVTFANLTSSDLNGDMVWIKQAGASATSYPLGFALGTKVVGSAYVAPQTEEKALNLAGGVVSFSGGNLTAPFNNVVSINPGSQVVNLSPNTLTFNITPSSGLFSGQVQEPDGGPTHAFNGVILQKLNAGYGTMDGSPLASRVVLAAP